MLLDNYNDSSPSYLTGWNYSNDLNEIIQYNTNRTEYNHLDFTASLSLSCILKWDSRINKKIYEDKYPSCVSVCYNCFY